MESSQQPEHPIQEQLQVDDMWQPQEENLCFGDDIDSDKNARTFRAYFQNVNSLKSTKWAKWLSACHLMKKKKVDLFGFAEIGINPTFPGAVEDICQIARKNWMHATTTLHNTKQTQHGLAQRGGTSITTTQHWVSRIVERGRDEILGRWCYHILRGKGKHRVVFVSAYRVVQTSVAGPTTAATQQWAALIKEGHQDPNP